MGDRPVGFRFIIQTMNKLKERTSQTAMLTVILMTCGLYLGWRLHTRRTSFHYHKLDAEMDALREAMSEQRA
jgi:hypothetical protein